MTVYPIMDCWTCYDPTAVPAGWRTSMADALVAGAPLEPHARQAYKAALFVMRANALPPAFGRDVSTAQFQAQVGFAIARLERDEEKRHEQQ